MSSYNAIGNWPVSAREATRTSSMVFVLRDEAECNSINTLLVSLSKTRGLTGEMGAVL